MRILITGATGFIGRKLCAHFHRRGDAVVALVRDPLAAQDELYGRTRIVGWHPPARGPWYEELANVDAVINLAGEPLVGRWTDEHKRRVRDSRILTTRALVEGLAATAASARPKVLVQASAVGYYGSTTDEVDESAPNGKDALAKLCVDWEGEAMKAEGLGMRVVRTRFGIVLGEGGGALQKMLLPFKLFVGGPMGDGNQWWSWVHVDDVVGMVEHAVRNESTVGALNVVGPTPVTNREFVKELGDVLGRPAIFPAPAGVLRAALGEGADVLLEGQRVIPRKAIDFEYPFVQPTLRGAIKASLGMD